MQRPASEMLIFLKQKIALRSSGEKMMGESEKVNGSALVSSTSHRSDKSVRDLSNSEKNFVRNCVDVIHRIVRLYGFEDQFNGKGYSIKGTYDHWIRCCSMVQDHPVKFVKYKIAAFYSASKGQVLPPSVWNVRGEDGLYVDDPSVLMGGRVMKFIRLLSRQPDNRYESLCTSILYSKKGMPRPPKSFLNDAEKAAFKKLTAVPTEQKAFSIRSWADENDSVISSNIDKQRLKDEIERTVREIFTRQYDDEHRQRLFFPSGSANYINSRSKGGVIGQLFDEHNELLAGLRSEDKLIRLGREVRMDVNENEVKDSISTVDLTPLDDKFRELYRRVCDKALYEEQPLAVPMALPEALKARVITKGPGLLYTALKPLQLFLHGELSRHKVFRLTGETVSDLGLQDIIGSKLKDGESFMSVDYADATNQIESWATEFAMRSISESVGLTVEEELMALRSLTGHLMVMKSRGKPDVVLPQLNGQLMGGILSFIILCVINAAVLRTTKEVADDRSYTLNDACIAVNGDDGVVKTSEFGMTVWERIGSFVGLTPSIGKVYFSREFLNINSTTYNYHPDGWEGYRILKSTGDYAVRVSHYEHVKYVNMGLMLSMKRSGGEMTSVDTDSNGVTFGGRVTNLIETAPSFLQERVLGQFIHMNKKKILVDLPYFIPESLGGLGLPSVGKYTSSDSDLRHARKIFENPDVFRMPQRPLDTMWKTWEYAVKRFPSTMINFNSIDVVESAGTNMTLSQVRSKACIEALFCAPDLATLLKDTVNDVNVLGYQRRCQRVWRRARLSPIPVPEPYHQGRFPKQFNNDDRPIFPVIRRDAQVDEFVKMTPYCQ